MCTMKSRLITVFTSILFLLTFIFSPSAPLITSYKVFAEEYLSPLEELQASEGFDEISLSTKTDITVIDFMEYWDDKAEFPLYFVYVYNPTDKVLKDSTDNRIHIQTNNSGHWNSYKLSYIKATEDGKYVKYVVENSKEVYESHTDKDKRFYKLSDIKLVCDDDRTPSTFTVGYKYLYSGKEDLDVKKEEYDVIKVENLLPLVYRNIKESVYEYPNGQINSVAFSLSNDVLEKYGEVSEIHFEYYRYRTSPIVVTDTRNGFNAHDKRNEWVGKEVKSSDRSNPMCLTWGGSYESITLGRYVCEFGYNGYMLDAFGNKTNLPASVDKQYSKLAYSFVSPSGVKATKHDVSSKELTDWMYSYADTYLTGQEYESLPVKDGKLPAELFEDYKNEKYGYKDVYIKADTLSYTEQSSNWWNRLWGITDSVNYETIKSVSDTDLDLDAVVFSNLYLCNEGYVSSLKNLVLSSSLKNETVHVFRFNVSDYYVSPAKTWGTIGGSLGSDGHAYVAQTDVFLNFSFIDFTFCKDSVATVLAVSSDTIDNVPPTQHPVVPEGFDWLYWLKFIVSIVFWVVVIILGWKYFVYPILRFIFNNKKGRKK